MRHANRPDARFRWMPASVRDRGRSGGHTVLRFIERPLDGAARQLAADFVLRIASKRSHSERR